jgi:hypothetical protein
MTNIEIIYMYVVGWATTIGILGGIFVARKLHWGRFLLCILLGTVLGFIIAGSFTTAASLSMHVAIFIAYVISYVLVCTPLLRNLFNLLPAKAQKRLRIILVVLLTLAMLVAIIMFMK